MNSIELSRSKGYLVVGVIGVFLSVTYLALSFQLPMGRLRQPGSGVFPAMAGIAFLVGSLAAILEGIRPSRGETYELPVGEDCRRVLTVLGGVFAYLVLLPWLGQLLSSLLFCILLIKALSTLSMVRVLIYAVLMSSMAYVLFVTILKLPMPAGIFS